MFTQTRTNDPQRGIDPRIASAFNRDRDVANSQAAGFAANAANQAAGQIGAVKAAQPGEFAKTMGGTYAAYAPAAADAYGSYATGMGNAATAMANERGRMYSANALAEAARQGTAGTLGAAALGAYGSAANTALSSWGQNQAAYNKAMSDMHGANQSAMAGYGQTRNQALAGLGGAYMGAGLAGGYGGDSFSASGPDGSIAYGSYGGSPGGYGGQAFGGLDSIRASLMNPDMANRLDRGADLGRMQADAQHYSSRGMPSQMLDQALGGLTSLGTQAYGQSSAGMKDFYAAQNRAGDQFMQGMPGILGNLNSGYQGLADSLRGGFGNTTQNIGRIFNRTIANEYPNPAIWKQPVGAFT